MPPCRGIQPRYDTHSHVPSRRLSELPHVQKAVDRKAALHRQRAKETAEEKHAELRAKARSLLSEACDRPFWPVARLFDIIGHQSPTVEKAILEELEDAGYVKLKKTRVSRLNTILIEPTQKAWSLLGKPPIELESP